MVMAKKRNYAKEAFFKSPNLVFLAIGGLAALAFGSVGLGIVVIGVEAAYVIGLSRSKWFHKRVRVRKGWGGGLITAREREKLASELTEGNAGRYSAFRGKYRMICDRAEKDFSDDPMVRAAVQNLETLSDTFLKLLLTGQRTRAFLEKADRGALLSKIEQEKKEAAQAEGRVREMRLRNVQLLEGRIERIDKAEQTVKIIEEQMEMIETSMDATHDNMMTMDKISEVGTQIDLMMTNLGDAQKLVTEMDSLVLSAEPIDDSVPEPLRSKERT